MRALLQRVRSASVEVEGKIVGSIGPGLLVFLGVAPDDTAADAEYLAEKTAHLRIFEDEEGRMNRCVLEAGSAVLAISQFTLYADCRKGRRPGFSGAAAPETADPLYRRYAEQPSRRYVFDFDMGDGESPLLVKVGLSAGGGFAEAALPETAEPLYRRYAELLKENGIESVERGIFGADMLVKLENDGPATFLLESK